MPKTTKRAATRRAARIAKAHATELPKLQVKAPTRNAPGIKRPARGLARYPWAVFLTILVIAGSIYGLYYFKAGPFAKSKAPTSITNKKVVPTPTPDLKLLSPSPCLKVVKQLTNTSPAPSKSKFDLITHTFPEPPFMTIDVHKFYCAGINTNRGLIVIELDPQYAPVTVNNFVFLARNSFYDGLTFHRVVPGFVIQGGDPKGDGSGGPGYKFNDEPVLGSYTAGWVAMANSGPNTNGSQFFICTVDDTTKLQKLYNLFGHVVLGMDVVLKIQGPDSNNPKTKNIKPDVMNHVIVVQAP
jgi:peptidylprolyl isomerase